MCAQQHSGQTINKVVLLEIEKIIPNPSQPRVDFNQEEIESLAKSILANGLLQPLTVRRLDKKYELISGERRLRAMRFLGITLTPAIIIETSDQQSAVFSLLENLQREDLNCFEEATAMKALIMQWGISQQTLGERLGKAQPTIANKLRLLRFNEETQTYMLRNGINERQARALLKIEDKTTLELALRSIVARKLNAKQTEKYVEDLLSSKNVNKKNVHPIVKDVRIFINTITNAISLMNESGIAAKSERKDCDDYIEYIVKIPIKERKINVN